MNNIGQEQGKVKSANRSAADRECIVCGAFV